MPRGVYERRKIMTGATTNGEPQPYSQFLTDLGESLAKRDQEIKDEINAIDNQMTTMTTQRAELIDEQAKVEAGLKALQ
jgi:hypothetical protein